jgi:molybdenum cofactor synthesis domain-containing protein
MIKKVRVEEAIGMALAHDLTKVVPGGFKGPAFKRGHIITKGDIPELLSIGKEHVFVLNLTEGQVHEEEAAIRIAKAVMGKGLTSSLPSEGRVNLKTTSDGLLKINTAALDEINLLGDIIIATIHNNTVCKKDVTVAGTRIIQLYTSEEKLTKMEQLAEKNQPVISIAPMKLKKIGLIVTGSEVYKGRIKDGFSPILHKKIEALGCTVNNEEIVPDDPDIIARTIQNFKDKGSDVILCCSGMSVDPDDVTPQGIRKSGAEVRFYGLPVLPGAMFLYAKLGNVHILGVPACVLHAPTTAFDVLFPRVLTDEELTFEGTRGLGHGGLCLKCDECKYPVCPFCK